MSGKLDCRKCGADLEDFNVVVGRRVRYCPCCGTRVLKAQSEALARKTTDGEIEDMIKDHLFDALQRFDGGDISADALADLAWETERCDGVVFYDNYRASRFAARHGEWVDDALDWAVDVYGESGRYVRMLAECVDRFLVVAFILATRHFLSSLPGAERNEGGAAKKRIAEIKRLIKTASYDGGF